MKTNIFVSSTCYDLGQVRENLSDCISSLGHTPLLSEHSSFPVSPDLTTVENCRKNVREHADIFFLIVGGRRGSLDVETGKPVTNIEYEEAKQSGIETFVFVKKEVLNLLPVWERNPATDFTPAVDYPEVFSFIKRIKTEQNWVFPYESSRDIIEIIKNQLSVLLKELLKRKREGRLTLPKEFINDSPAVKKIVLDKPRFWEYLLTIQLLKDYLPDLNNEIELLKRNLVYRKTKILKGRETLNFLQEKFADAIKIIKIIDNIINEDIKKSWGPPGQSGDATKIRDVISRLIYLCRELINWESELRSIKPPDYFKDIIAILYGCTFEILEEINKLPLELEKPFIEPNPTGEYIITLTFKVPDSINIFPEKLNALVNDPNVLLDFE